MIAALVGLALAASAPDSALDAYQACVEESFRHPDEESAGTDEAIELAKSACGNLRPAAVAEVRKMRARMSSAMGDPEEDAQRYLDVLVRVRLGVLTAPATQSGKRGE